MQGEELHFRYDYETSTWFAYFGAPDKAKITCEGCKRLIQQRVYLNFDTGSKYCESCKEKSVTNFIQNIEKEG